MLQILHFAFGSVQDDKIGSVQDDKIGSVQDDKIGVVQDDDVIRIYKKTSQKIL